MYDQQLVIKAVVAKVSTGGLLSDPMRFDNLIVAAAEALTVDKSLDLQQLALAVRDVKPADITYATVPTTSASLQTFAGTAVRLDDQKAAALFAAVRADTVDQWLAAHPQRPPR